MTEHEVKMSQADMVFKILGFKRIHEETHGKLPQELQIVDIIRRGFPVDSARRVAEYYGITDAQVATLLGASERTLSRRRKEDKPLDATESDRLYRLARIGVRTLEVFENDETSRKWLKRPNRALGGAVPLEMLDTDAGTEQVDELLTRIEYGVYS